MSRNVEIRVIEESEEELLYTQPLDVKPNTKGDRVEIKIMREVQFTYTIKLEKNY